MTKKTGKNSDTYKNRKKQSNIHDIYAHLDGIKTPKTSKKQQKNATEPMKETEKTEEQPSEQQEFIYQCPYCKELITFDAPIEPDNKIDCPHCGYHYIHPFHETEKEPVTNQDKKQKKEKKSLHIPRPHIRLPSEAKKERKREKKSKQSKKRFNKPIIHIHLKRKTPTKSYIPPKKQEKPSKEKTKKILKTKITQHLTHYNLTKPEIKTIPQRIKQTIKTNPIESLIIIIGLLFLLQPTLETIKISITLMLIGSILLLFPTSSTTPLKAKTPPLPHQKKTDAIKQKLIDIKNRLTFQETISILLIIWILFLFLITTPQQLDIYFILIFIGFLLTKELTSNLLPQKTQQHLTIYILIFLIAYIYLIIQKVLETMNTIS